MSSFSVKLEALPHKLNNQFHWCIDFPSSSDNFSAQELLAKGLHIAGWLLSRPGNNGKMVIFYDTDAFPLQQNKNREDVVRKLCGEGSIWEKKYLCGFEHNIPIKSNRFTIGLIYKGEIHPLYIGTIKGSFKVLKGKNDWLFLDNDTNKSVEQFKGKYKLKRKEKKLWKEYMTSFCSCTNNNNIPSAFLIAPAKEYVVPEEYPHSGPFNTPLEQIKKIAPSNFPLLDLTSSLKAQEQRMFRMCDTHWTAHGARVATLELIKKLGLSTSDINKVFKKDIYREKQTGGDLGSKLFPPKTALEQHLINFSYKDHVVYDNGLSNIGKVLILENTDSLTENNITIFGSSSSYAMFNYICRYFSTVLFIHSAGSIDKEILLKLKPCFLVAQTNSRFLVRAPEFDFNLSSMTSRNNHKESKSLLTTSSPKTRFTLEAYDVICHGA